MSTPFSVGDILVYPSYGIVEVKDREKTEVGDYKLEVYVLRTLERSTDIRVPVKNSDKVGLRRLVAHDKVENIYAILNEPGGQYETPWYERCRINEARIKGGVLEEIARVITDTYFLKDRGEQLNKKEVELQKEAEKLLVNELSYVEKRKKQEIRNQIKAIMKHKAAEERE